MCCGRCSPLLPSECSTLVWAQSKPASFLGLSTVSCHQRWLQKLTLEKLMLGLFFTRTSGSKLAYWLLCGLADPGHGISTRGSWAKTDELQKFRMFLRNLTIISANLCLVLLLAVVKTTMHVLQPQAAVSQSAPVNFPGAWLPTAWLSCLEHLTWSSWPWWLQWWQCLG